MLGVGNYLIAPLGNYLMLRGLRLGNYLIADRVQLARAFLGTGDASKAIDELEYCLRMDSADGEAAVWLADVYESQGRMRKAKAVLQSVEALLPGQAGVREALDRLEAAPSP